MTTSDATRGALSAGDPLERTLIDLLAFEPAVDVWDRLDERVKAAVAVGAAAATPRQAGTGRRSRRKTIALLAAAALVVGAGGVTGLYDGMGAAFEYGFELQLVRSTEVGASHEIDGYRVTIDRAFLDGERLMLAVRTVDELKRPDRLSVYAFSATVSDAGGMWQGGGAASGRELGQWASASVLWALVPPDAILAGTQRLHVVVDHVEWYDAAALPAPTTEDQEWTPWRRHDGPWVFDIEVPVSGGTSATTVSPSVTVDIDGVPVTLTSAVIGSTVTRVDLETPVDSGSWSFLGELRHGTQVFRGVLASFDPADPWRLQFDGGVDDPSGDWTLVITRVDRNVDGQAEQRIDGPWEFEFTVP